MKDKGIEITLSQDALDFLIEKGFDPVYGARPLKRTIQRYLEDQLSENIISGRLKDGTKINVIREAEQLVFT